MEQSRQRAKIIEELQRIPEERLAEVYAIVHDFRTGLEAAAGPGQALLRFAGAWEDMPEETFGAFLAEIEARRQAAFRRRRRHAGGPD